MTGQNPTHVAKCHPAIALHVPLHTDKRVSEITFHARHMSQPFGLGAAGKGRVLVDGVVGGWMGLAVGG